MECTVLIHQIDFVFSNRWQGWGDFFGTNGSTEVEFSVDDDDDPDEVECVRPEMEDNGGAGGTGGGGGGTAISSTPSDDVEMEEGVDAETAAGSGTFIAGGASEKERDCVRMWGECVCCTCHVFGCLGAWV